jgi:hypothetical protein
MGQRGIGDPRSFLVSLFVFVAWIVAATGWVRALAAIWLVYPAVVAWRVLGRAKS